MMVEGDDLELILKKTSSSRKEKSTMILIQQSNKYG